MFYIEKSPYHKRDAIHCDFAFLFLFVGTHFGKLKFSQKLMIWGSLSIARVFRDFFDYELGKLPKQICEISGKSV